MSNVLAPGTAAPDFMLPVTPDQSSHCGNYAGVR
jgi:hypothetical protein